MLWLHPVQNGGGMFTFSEGTFTIPTPAPKQVYVTIKQLLACSSLTLFKHSVAGPPETELFVWSAQTRKLSLKEAMPLLAASK